MITLPSELKLSLGKRILSLGLGFLIPSSQTTNFNLIARLSKGIVVNWVSRIGTPLLLIHEGMDNPMLSIRL